MTIEEIKAFIEGLGKGYTVELMKTGDATTDYFRKTIMIRDGLKQFEYTLSLDALEDAHPGVLENYIEHVILPQLEKLEG